MALDSNLGPTIGALVIGLNVSGVLFGCETLQIYLYYRKYPNDPRGLKCFVALIWIIEICQHISMSRALYVLSVIEWGNPSALLVQPNSISASFFIGICVLPLVESFYLFRIHKISGKVYPVLIGVTTVWVRYAGWLVFAVEEYKLGFSSGKLIKKWSWLLISLLGLGVAVDAVVAITMAYYLFRRRDLGFIRTTRLVDRLIMWTVQTGVITSITLLATLITFLVMENSLIWMGVATCVTKIFANCLLASLNARKPTQVIDKDASLHASRVGRTQARTEVPPILINVSKEISNSDINHTMVSDCLDYTGRRIEA